MPTFHIGNVPVEFVEQGSGDPVVLLHCSGSSQLQWRALIDRLSRDFRVLAPDLYGYGATGAWPEHASFTLEDEAQIVLALLERCGEPAHLVGHSYGGAVALHVARTRSELVRSVAVIEPVAFHLLRDGDDEDDAAFVEVASIAGAVERSLDRGDYEHGFGCFVDYWSGAGAWAAIPQAKRSAFAAHLPKVALDFRATIRHRARSRDFRRLAVPALVIQGECSPQPTRRICAGLAGTLPDVRLATVPNAGHMCPMTHREQTNELLVAFVERRPRRAR